MQKAGGGVVVGLLAEEPLYIFLMKEISLTLHMQDQKLGLYFRGETVICSKLFGEEIITQSNKFSTSEIQSLKWLL